MKGSWNYNRPRKQLFFGGCTLVFLRLIAFFVLTHASLVLLSSHAPSQLTWHDCVRTTTQHNPELKAYRRAVQGSKHGITVAKAGYFPDVSITLEANRSKSNTGSSATYNTRQTYTGQVSTEVFSGFETVARERIAKVEHQKSQTQLFQIKVRLRADLRKAFAQALFAQRNIHLSRQIRKRLKQNTDFMNIRYQGGLEARWAYAQARADFEESQWQVEKAKLGFESAQHSLRSILGQKDLGNFRLKGSFYLPPPPSLDDVWKRFFETHPNIVFQRHQVKQAEWEIDREKSGYYPTVSLYGRWGVNGTNRFPDKDQWTIGVELAMPLFSGFETLGSVRKARQAYFQADFLLQNVRLQTRSTIQTTYNQYVVSRSRVKVTKRTLDAAKERSRVIQKEYDMGLKQFLDWERSQSLLTTAERQHLVAQRDALIALGTLEQALGKGLK